jgi:hypothetical protein
MGRVSLFGVQLSWTCEGLASDPVARLIAPVNPIIARELLPQSDSPAPLLERGRVHIALRPASAETAADPLAEGYRPSFFQGVVQGYREPASAEQTAFLLWDRASRVRVPLAVPSDGSPTTAVLEAEIAPPERELTPGSAIGMLQIALALALRREGLFHLHAAAVVHPSGARILIAGGSGAGKTTTTLALIDAGYDYLGDDTLYLRQNPPGDPAPLTLFAFPREFHLGPETLAAFPRLALLAGASSSSRGKRPLDPHLAFPGKSRAFMPSPSLVLVPQIARSAAASALVPLAKADAFGALLASSAAILIDGAPGRDQNMALLPKLLDGAAAYDLLLGRDVLASPAAALAPLVDSALTP